MKTYTQTKSRWYRRSLSLREDDVLLYEKNTPFGYSLEIIPLVFFSPHPKVFVKQVPTIATWLLKLLVGGIGVFFIAMFESAKFAAMVDLPMVLAFICSVLLGASLYYYFQTRTSLRFQHYNNDNQYISFSYSKQDRKQKRFIEKFTMAVKTARVNSDQRNFVLMHEGIDSLERQQIIGSQFRDELHDRVTELSETSI